MEAARERPRVLIVDDDAHEVERICTVLGSRFVCETASSGEAALGAVKEDAFAVVLSTTTVGALRWQDFLDGVLRQSPSTRFVLIGDDTSPGQLMEAGRRGAHDYIALPVDDAAFTTRVDRAVQDRPAIGDAMSEAAAPARVLIGGASKLVAVLDAVDRVAHAASPVLLLGESGTGKELLASRIHARGPRRHRPFAAVNVGATSPGLLESELFGHVDGAFTGATRARRGRVEETNGGTVFLDEVLDLSSELQGRLLRVLELGAVRAVGGDRDRHVDVRFIVATQHDLRDAMRSGRLREDLYFRVHGLAIRVPPLRERREDIPSLLSYFFEQARARNPRSPVTDISSGARERLVAAGWPGNIRELQAVIERLVVLGQTPSVESSDIDAVEAAVRRDVGSRSRSPEAEPLTLREVTTHHVEAVLGYTQGDKTRAAQLLGVDVSTLYRWRRRRPSDPA